MADTHPKFEVSLVTPEGDAFRGDAEMLIVPGAAGDIGVLARHAPLVATLGRARPASTSTVPPRTCSSSRPARASSRSSWTRRSRSSTTPSTSREIDDARAQEQLETAKAELEKVEAGDSTSDRWQLEQRIKHAENQLTVSGRTDGVAPTCAADAALGRA